MKEHPIIFNSDMVKAILDGRKTQTRRVIKDSFFPKTTKTTTNFAGETLKKTIDKVQIHPSDNCVGSEWYENGKLVVIPSRFKEIMIKKCPFGKVGDRLWARETWHFLGTDRMRLGRTHLIQDGVVEYKDGSKRTITTHWESTEKYMTKADRWRPSIHMPRWASRITLEITDIRVERLQEIKHKDFLCEGYPTKDETFYVEYGKYKWAEEWFIGLWNSIHKKQHRWEDNPWVFIISFRKELQ